MIKLFVKLSIVMFVVLSTFELKAQACFDSTYNSSISANTAYNVYVSNTNQIIGAYSIGLSFNYLGSEATFLSGQTCYDIAYLSDDSVYIATINGLKVLNIPTATVYNSSNILSNNVKCVEIDKYNNVWAGGDNGLAEFNITSGWVDKSAEVSGAAVNDIFADTANGYVYVVTDSKIYQLNSSTNISWDKADIDASIEQISCVAVDKDENIWIGTKGSIYASKGIYKLSGGAITHYSLQDGYLYSNQINDLKFDKYGNLWASTDIGLTYYDGFKWYTFTTADGLPSTTVNSSYIAENGYIWVACDDNEIPIMTGGILDIQVNDNYTYPVGENKVLVELYYDHPLPGVGYNKFAEAYTDVNGNAHFDGLLNYDYYVKATVVDSALLASGLVSTYNGGALSYDSAQVISVSCNNNNYGTINLLYYPVPTGTGSISGIVKYHTYSKAAGEPVPGAEVIVEQEPNDDPVTMSSTDNNTGQYSINNLNAGTYKVELEFPGIPKITSYTNVQVTGSNNSLNNLNFLVDTTVANGGAYADSITYAPINFSDKVMLNVYPNPTNDMLNIDISGDNTNLNIELYNLQGQKIYAQKLKSEKNKIYLKNLKINKGIYFVKVYNRNNVYIKKILYN